MRSNSKESRRAPATETTGQEGAGDYRVVAVEQRRSEETRADKQIGVVLLGIELNDGGQPDDKRQKRGNDLHDGVQLSATLPRASRQNGIGQDQPGRQSYVLLDACQAEVSHFEGKAGGRASP